MKNNKPKTEGSGGPIEDKSDSIFFAYRNGKRNRYGVNIPLKSEMDFILKKRIERSLNPPSWEAFIPYLVGALIIGIIFLLIYMARTAGIQIGLDQCDVKSFNPYDLKLEK